MKFSLCTLRPLAIMLLLVMIAAPARSDDDVPVDAKDVVKRTFEVESGGTLDIDLDHGNVEVITGQANEVVVEVERIVKADDRREVERILEQHHVAFDQRDDDVYVESRFDAGSGGFWGRDRDNRLKVHIRIIVPREYSVEFRSGAGNVDVAALRGYVSGKTGAGNVVIGEVTGPVDVSSGAGNVEIRGAIGRVAAHSGAGNITLYDIRGTVEAKTGAGNVKAYITEQPESESRLESGAGNVTVTLADGIGVYVDAVASLGSADTDYPLEVEGKWMKRSFAGEVNGGGPQVTMRAGVGNVSLKRR